MRAQGLWLLVILGSLGCAEGKIGEAPLPPAVETTFQVSSGGGTLETPQHQVHVVVGPAASVVTTPKHIIHVGVAGAQQGQLVRRAPTPKR